MNYKSKNSWSDDKLLSRLILNKSKKNYWDYLHLLRQRPTEPLFLKCKALIVSGSLKEKILGVNIIAQFGISRPFLKQTIPLLFDLLKTENHPQILSAIFHAIAHNNKALSTSQIQSICLFKNHKSKQVRDSLVHALLGINDKVAVDTLIQLSSDKTDYIRDWATFGLGTQIRKTNKKILEALWNRVNDKDENTRFEALIGLAKRRDKRVKVLIIKELENTNFGTLLFNAIKELKDIDFLPYLEQLSTSKQSLHPEWLESLKECISYLIKVH